MKKFVKNIYIIFRTVLSHIGNITRPLSDKLAIIYIDGGLSSQIFRYSMGQYFKEMGFDVFYDVSWYQGRMASEKKMELAIKDFVDESEMRFLGRDSFLLKKYKLLYNTAYNGMAKSAQDDITTLKAPFCINNYEMDWIMKSINEKRYFPWSNIERKLSDNAKEILEGIIDNNVCGIHIRRGDMSYYVKGAYWKVLTPRYYEKSLDFIPKEVRKVLIFTNGIDWVKKEIIPIIEKRGYDIIVVSELGLKEYEELFLLSKCNCIIASQGSWGNTALDFNSNNEVLWVKGVEHIKEEKDKFIKKYPNYEMGLFELEDDMYLHE
ncbi:MAG: alpha-1,2-fucosyltransferase [Pseudobutyrivibrio sp.]|nr:alpha-1,2-fucosyltransferase [Pseudobutyrivibrio sp.]